MAGENPAGVIDIGSRSIKLLIGQVVKDDIEIIESLKNVVPIAHDAFLKNRISQETINQTASILEKYKQVLKDYKIDQPKVVATTAMREAENRDLLTDTLYRKTGLSVEILTGGDIV
jgi:exopolyphosphatase/guanosine-5'-triphosphate,3'-diphosphate pyrophosphatase